MKREVLPKKKKAHLLSHDDDVYILHNRYLYTVLGILVLII